MEGLIRARAPPRRVTSSGDVGGVSVNVDADTRTRRYMGAVVRGIRIGPSPQWLVARLAAAEVRSINNVVDATNYVLHELGQPVHAFDAARIANGKIIVRKSRAGEKLTTLDGALRTLPGDAVVIADGERGQAVAGIMGGRDSEVTDATTDLFIEVASFDPKFTRATRRALGLSTDASYRFERGVDPELGPVAMDRVVRLIVSLAGGTVQGILDVAGEARPRPEISVRAKRIAQVLGETVPLDRSARYLSDAGFEILKTATDQLTVRVPSWRGDVSAEVDLIEEVARFHGYDKFPDDIRPFRPTNTFDDPQWTVAGAIREKLVGQGLYEIWPIPFVRGSDDTHVRLANPLAENEGHLRHSLLETLARRAEYNLGQRTGDVRLFEIGSVSLPEGTSVREELRVGILIMGRR